MKKIIIPKPKDSTEEIDLICVTPEHTILVRDAKTKKPIGFISKHDDYDNYIVLNTIGDAIVDDNYESIIDLIKDNSTKYSFEVVD